MITKTRIKGRGMHATGNWKTLTLAVLCLTATGIAAQADDPNEYEELLMPFSTLINQTGDDTILDRNLEVVLKIQNNASAERRALAALDTYNEYTRLATGMGDVFSQKFWDGITNSNLDDNFTDVFGKNPAIDADPKAYFANPESNFTPGGTNNQYGKAYGDPIAPFDNNNGNGFSPTDPRPFQVRPDPAQAPATPHTTPGDFVVTFPVTKVWQGPSAGVAAAEVPFNPSSGMKNNYDPGSFLQTTAAFPSGHTIQGVQSSIIYGLMLPELYQKMALRGSQYGESRMVMGEHWATDVTGSRIVTLYGLAQYMNDMGGFEDLQANQTTLREYFEGTYSGENAGSLYESDLREAAHFTPQGLEDAASTYKYRLTYDLGNQGEANPDALTIPEAGVLLSLRFPYLIDFDANNTDRFAAHSEIIRTTMNNVGGPFDNNLYGGIYEGWSLINLFAAGGATRSWPPT